MASRSPRRRLDRPLSRHRNRRCESCGGPIRSAVTITNMTEAQTDSATHKSAQPPFYLLGGLGRLFYEERRLGGPWPASATVIPLAELETAKNR
jgi:hypothetical protein